jgi:NAD(P)-dependent dehydrogenase (short-subunit alcohol dehydrogenase family)
MTKAWARELAPYGIIANLVAPGGVWTDMVLKARGAEFIRGGGAQSPTRPLGTTRRVLRLVAYLAFDEATFITGQVIHQMAARVSSAFKY